MRQGRFQNPLGAEVLARLLDQQLHAVVDPQRDHTGRQHHVIRGGERADPAAPSQASWSASSTRAKQCREVHVFCIEAIGRGGVLCLVFGVCGPCPKILPTKAGTTAPVVHAGSTCVQQPLKTRTPATNGLRMLAKQHRLKFQKKLPKTVAAGMRPADPGSRIRALCAFD